MVVKQPTQTCICGKEMSFPCGEIKCVCSCERIWEISSSGVWFTNLNLSFEPQIKNLTMPRVRNKRKRKAGMK